MPTTSFSDISSVNWQPSTTYQAVQSSIQSEVNQGVWDNDAHIDIWCTIAVSPPQGVNNSWVTFTYSNSNSQTQTVLWPSGWPAPAEDKNGRLPSHFFVRTTGGTGAHPGAIAVQVLSDTDTAPAAQPAYRVARACI